RPAVPGRDARDQLPAAGCAVPTAADPGGGVDAESLRRRPLQPVVSMSRSLAGKVALVTGASRGIGEHIVERLLAEGMKVALAARSLEDLERVRASLDPGGERTAIFQLDVVDAEACRETVAAAARTLGEIDVLVNNAGVEVLAPFVEADIE